MKRLLFSFIFLSYWTFSQLPNMKKKCYEDSLDAEGYIVSDCGRKRGITNFDDKLMVEPGTNIILWRHNQHPFTGECESCNSINEKTQFRFKVENGNINGTYVQNYQSGCIQERGNKVMGKFDGQIELFYDTTSAIREVANYILGKLDGHQLELTPQGDTIAFQNYKVISKGDKIESILHGVQKLYYSNGKIESEVNYNLGQLDGDYKKYSKEGILLNDRKFRKGKENGKCVSYYDDGKKLLEENWKDGVKDGAFILYTPNDSIKSQEYYKKGLPDGTFIEYFDNRQIQSKIIYSKGKKVSEKYWNEYGQDVTEEKKKEMDKEPKKEDKNQQEDIKKKESKKGKKDKSNKGNKEEEQEL
jgi:antitoxin component YwqK of YwqJK toxin-antitoxin module